MAQYLIQDTTLTNIADAIRSKTGGTDAIKVSDMASQIEEITGGGGGGSGDYIVKVVDYDGTILSKSAFNEGDTFTLPDAPIHEGLVFDGWSSPFAITGNKITVPNNDVVVGPTYHTESGATEVDIVLTTSTGLSFAFLNRLKGMTSIDWGDGNTNSALTHTYSNYGEYTIKIYGMTAVADGASDGGMVSGGSGYPTNTSIVAVRFASSVATIGSYVLQGCVSLKTVTIPLGATSSFYHAFDYCRNLKAIIIPEGVTTISERAFYSCQELSACITPSTLTTFGPSSFEGCKSITEAVIPANATISSRLFRDCYRMRSITMLGQVSAIDTGAFTNCNVKELDFTKCTSVTTLSAAANSTFNGSVPPWFLVPANLYDDWIVATNWSPWKDYIVAV